MNLGTAASLIGTPLTVASGATFVESVGGIVSGAAAFASAGTSTLAGTNARSGPTALSGGTLNLNSASAIGSGALTITGGAIDNTSGAAVTPRSTIPTAAQHLSAGGGERHQNEPRRDPERHWHI